MNTLNLFILGTLAIILPVAEAEADIIGNSISNYTQAQIEAIQHYGVPVSIDKLKWTYEYNDYTLIISFCYSGEHREGDFKKNKLANGSQLIRHTTTHCIPDCRKGRLIIANVQQAKEIESVLRKQALKDGQHVPSEGRREARRP